MACCCYFVVGVHISCKAVISVKENQYRALYDTAGQTIGADDLPSLTLSPSYSTWSNSEKGGGGFSDLQRLDKFSVLRSENEIGCFVVNDASQNQVCVIRMRQRCGGFTNDFIYSDNQGNELVRMAIEYSAPQGSRRIGSVKASQTCICSSVKIYGETSDFHLNEKADQNGKRYYESNTNEELGKVFTTSKGANGSFPGKWANTTELTISPNPPKANQPVTIYFKFTAVDDLWFGNFRGNVTRLEDKWVYSFDKVVCGTKGLCPIRKGDTREYNETFPSPSTFVRSGTYRGWTVMINQDDEIIYDLTMHDCPL